MVMSGLTFLVDYVVLHTLEVANAYALLLSKPWLFQDEVVHNWQKGTLTISDYSIQVKQAIHNLSYSSNNSNTYLKITSTQGDNSREQEYESMSINITKEIANVNSSLPIIAQTTKKMKIVIKNVMKGQLVKRMYDHQ